MAKGTTAGEGGGAPGGGGPEHYFALPAGTKIFEFEIESVLGHGGFGITYKAIDTDLQKTVAIKEFFPNDLAGRASSVTVRAKSSVQAEEFQQGLKAFLEEARLIARFQHPNIVGVQRFFEAHGTGYIVFTYETGQTLSQRLAAGPLPEAELRQILGGVLAGLGVVHEAAILHRDLKPNNIMLRGDGTPVLIDFGAARDFQHRHSRTVTAIASAGYAPPEQYGVGGQQGPWSDFYALGAIAYRCVTGVTPTDSLRRLRNDPLKPAVEAARGKYDADLLRTIDWMLRIEEADRPSSVAEVRAALAGGAIPERKDGGPEQSVVQERPRRRGLMWLTTGGLIAALSASAVAGVMIGGPEQIKTFACTHTGLWCGDRLAAEPAAQVANARIVPPQSQSSSGKQDPTTSAMGNATPDSHSPASVPAAASVAAVGSPPSASTPQSSGPAASSPGSNSSSTASLSSPAPARGASPPAANPEQAAKAPGPVLSEAAEAWAATKDTTSIPVLETFATHYKDTFYAEMAAARIEELKKQQVAANMTPPTPAPDETAWAKIKDSKDPEQVREFLKQFHDSSMQAAAIARLAALEPKITECDELAASSTDEGKISSVASVPWIFLDVPKATVACERAVREFPDAMRVHFQLGRIYERGGNYQDARRAYTQAAEGGYPSAMIALGRLYEHGSGLPRDYAEARRWYLKAIDRSSAEAMVNLGELYEWGSGVPRDYTEAYRWFMKAAEVGNARAMYKIGTLYSDGKGLQKDYEQKRRWYLQAAELGNPAATHDLGWLYQHGEGVTKDFVEASKWYRKAADLGVLLAFVNLGLLYEEGAAGVARDYTQSAYWYRRGADFGYSEAMLGLGRLYGRGHGLAQDRGEERRWYMRAAELGNSKAMSNLGNIYDNGEGVARDYGEAHKWFLKAADRGLTSAMVDIGVHYARAQGVPKDFNEAKRWFEKAASRDNVVAMHNLGIMYRNGNGVPRDIAEARRWFTKAASLGYENSKKELIRLGK